MTETTEEPNAARLLAELSAARVEFEAIHNSLAQLEENVIPEDVREKIAEIREEFGPQLAEAEKRMKVLEEQVREAVVKAGHTIKGLRLQAVYLKPKAMWDNAKLEGYAASHPEILTLRTFGKPTVQIRENNGKTPVE